MDAKWFVKFEAYLQGEMGEQEKMLFEKDLDHDQAFRDAFRVYRRLETDMRQKAEMAGEVEDFKSNLNQLNQKYFQTESTKKGKVVPMDTFWTYRKSLAVAAGFVLIFVFYFLFFLSGPNPKDLATDYYTSNLKELSQTMSGSQDSIQMGIAAYNQQEYEAAKRYFETLAVHHPDNSEVIKNLGLTYLSAGSYDLALNQFEILAARSELYSNPGLFLKALTLMMRNNPGDRQKAKTTLEQVVATQSEGSNQAEIWLKKF